MNILRLALIRTTLALVFLCSGTTVLAKDKFSVLLGWFVNPDQAALVVAKQKGFFAKYDLDVDLVEPADPSMPPKLIAAGKGDVAIDFQPQLQMAVDQGLPLRRVATLVSSPLSTLVVLKSSGIKHIADLKGKTIGYSVSGFEESVLTTMLHEAGLTPNDVKLVNVNFSLVPSLLSGKVDAVFGAYRNVELKELALEGHPGLAFYPEEHGVPAYDEMILVANKDHLNDPRFDRFLTALEEATVYTLNHPDDAWEAFVSYKPNGDLDTAINRAAWPATLPRLALRPRAVDNDRYLRMAEFLKKHGIVKNIYPLQDYSVQLPLQK